MQQIDKGSKFYVEYLNLRERGLRSAAVFGFTSIRKNALCRSNLISGGIGECLGRNGRMAEDTEEQVRPGEEVHARFRPFLINV